jgi:hypothetical protein
MMNGQTQITGDAWGDDLDTRLQRATELCRIASKALTEITDQCNSGVAGATPWYIGAAYSHAHSVRKHPHKEDAVTTLNSSEELLEGVERDYQLGVIAD